MLCPYVFFISPFFFFFFFFFLMTRARARVRACVKGGVGVGRRKRRDFGISWVSCLKCFMCISFKNILFCSSKHLTALKLNVELIFRKVYVLFI